MKKKRAYKRQSVNEVSLEWLRDRAVTYGDAGTTVGLDVAKDEIVACVRWANGWYERPWSVKNPTEIGVLIELLQELKEICGSLTIGMESTGTYGDAVRHSMTEAMLEVHRVSGKGVSDYKEIFDGVPSQHDGKDAAMIAELTHFGKGTPWPYTPLSEADQAMRHQVLRMDAFRLQATQWTNRLEGLMARHWPEVKELLSLSGKTFLKVLATYGSPAALVADPNAAEQLYRWSCGNLKRKKIDRVLESARTTKGLPVGAAERLWIQEIAGEAMSALSQMEACKKQLEEMASQHAVMKKYAKAVGAVTLCVIWSTVGDPRQYDSSGAFLKALGLNLKELSSGKRLGEVAISKRGPSLTRKWLYFWALRGVRFELKDWYQDFQQEGKRAKGKHRKMKGIIALMRKLCRSLWYAMHCDLEFDYQKVFPGKPLKQQGMLAPANVIATAKQNEPSLRLDKRARPSPSPSIGPEQAGVGPM
jgi:transposase